MHLDDPQILCAEPIQQAFDRRRLPGSTRTEEQHVIGWMPPDELLDIRDEARDRRLDPDQIVEIEAVRLFDRHDSTWPAAHVPTEGDVTIEQPRRRGQSGEIFEQSLGQLENSPQSREEALLARHGRIVDREGRTCRRVWHEKVSGRSRFGTPPRLALHAQLDPTSDPIPGSASGSASIAARSSAPSSALSREVAGRESS